MLSRAAKTPVPLYGFVLGAVLYWASIPPLGLWPLAFLVPVAWAVTVGHVEKLRFRTVYFGAFLFWLASIWWIACPHPATFAGLIALSAYLAIYWPMFFSASRFAVHRLKIPAVLAMPVCWIGCEYLRNHLLGGFSFCSLEHALYLKPVFIQIADISGGYLVGGMVMLVGVGVAEKLVSTMPSTKTEPEKPEALTSKELFSGVLAVAVLLASVFYGVQTMERPISKDTPAFRVAALQGNIPVKLDNDQERNLLTYKQFVDLTVEAARTARSNSEPIDLVIWPETVCPVPYLQFHDVDPTEFGWTDELTDIWTRELGFLQNMVRQLDTPLLVGLSTLSFEKPPEPTRLNSALLLRPDAESDRPLYSKVHLVMFGEYIPFSKYLPDGFFIKTLCQEAGRGTGPVAFPLPTGDWGVVNICFESTIPHLVREQVMSFPESRLLINMSNDGWFRFSQQVDQHLATHVFRAVENRRAYVTATNGGFSAVIDHRGRIQAVGKRGTAEAVIGTVVLEHGSPIYHRIGDAIPLACAICLVGLLCAGIWSRRAAAVPAGTQADLELTVDEA